MISAEEKIKNKIYRFIVREIRKELIQCTTETLSDCIINDEFKIDDITNEYANKYDEHLFVYLHGYGLKEKHNEEKHVDLVLTPCDQAWPHITHLLFISPNNIVFIDKLYKFVIKQEFRENILTNVVKILTETGMNLKISVNYSEKMMNLVTENIRALMIKSLILHLYKPLNKSKIHINNIVCKMLDISYKYFDQNYEKLEEMEEIDNIRDPKLYQSKLIPAKSKEQLKYKSKTIEIKYEGFDDLLNNMLEVLWEEYNSENGGDISNSKLFAEYSEQINSRFNYNAYVEGFKTREQIVEQVSNPNYLNSDPNVATHDEMYLMINSIQQKVENDSRLDIDFEDQFNKMVIDDDTLNPKFDFH